MTPLWPPMTGTTTAGAIDRSLWISETKVEARTTSNVVTPKSLMYVVSISSRSPIWYSLLGIKNAMRFQDFGYDWYCRVYGIGDHQDESFGASGCDADRKIAYDAGVDL